MLDSGIILWYNVIKKELISNQPPNNVRDINLEGTKNVRSKFR